MKKTTKIMFFFCFIFVVFFSFCIASFAADIWDGSVSSEAPSQNARGYYLCKNGRDLAWVAKQVNSGYTNLKIMLTEDIYLNDIDNSLFVNSWTPIGNSERKFEGYFEGNNHYIYGLYINNSEKYQGLFGFLSNAHVNGLKLYNCNISANQYVGGICGYAASGTIISGSVVSGDIYASGGDCGGISGYGRIEVTFSSCGVKGAISSDGNRVAGIVGCCASNVVVEKCYNTANVSSSGKFVGGIVGTSSGSTVKSCYNTGNISGATRVGGIVGNNVADVFVSYNCGIITSPKERGAVCGFNSIANVKNCYYLENSCDNFDEFAIEKTAAEMKRYSFVVSLNKNGGEFVIDYQDENEGYPVLSWMIESDVWTRGLKKPSFYVDGTTYLITNAEELAWFAGLVNGTLEGVQQNQYAKAILTKSIILNLGEYDDEYSNIWDPIGSNGAEFFGEFDGNGKTISGIVVTDGDNSGLFGSVRSGATVKNLKIDKSYIVGDSAGGVAGSNLGTIKVVQVTTSYISSDNLSGGIVGDNEGTVIECSITESKVTSQSKCGGICGSNSGIVTASYNASAVFGTSCVGGIAGDNSGTISYCYNCAEVSSSDNYCAGIAAYCIDSTVSNCYNTGKISGKSFAGGIVGYSRYGEISSCYDVGEVKSTGVSGAVCASSSATSLSNLYYDSQRISVSDNNASALNTSQMSGSTALSIMSGFNRYDWSTTADGQYFYYYPQLNAISSSGNFDCYYDSLESVKFLKYEYHCKVDINESLSYFSNIKQAMEAIGNNTAVLYIFEDMSFAETATVLGDVTVIAENSNVSVSRATGYTGSLFNVKGILSLGRKNEEFTVTYDAMTTNSSICDSLIVVDASGTFNLVDSVVCRNTSLNGAAVYNNGISNFVGGVIRECVAFENAGAVYNRGTMTVNGSDICNNTSFGGGGAICNDSMSNVGTVLSGRIFNNNSSNGGAVYSLSGKVEIEGADIYSNSATNGGAVYVNGGIVECKGGSIHNNNADNGSAVFNQSGSFNMGDKGYIDQSNDVYLPTGKTVTMVSKLDFSSVCVNITPQAYQMNVRVVDGAFAATNYKRVSINDYQSQNWHINSSGHLLTDEVVEVAQVSILGAHSVYYTSLEEAFDDIGDNDAIITLIDDVTVNSTLSVRSNVTILSDSNQRTIVCSPEMEGPLFEVIGYSRLVLGDNVNKEVNDVIFIDGSSHDSSSLIVVEQSGVLDTYKGAVICNFSSETYSAVDLFGTMNFYGGKIIDNNCDYGAVNIESSAQLNIYGGEFDNSNISVYKSGELVFYNNAVLGESVVLINEGVITLDEDYSSDSLIAVIKFDRYTLSTLCVSTEADKTVYKRLFRIFDDCYYLDDEMKISADMLMLKSTTALEWNKQGNYVFGVDVDVNTAGNILSQFTNPNALIFDTDNQVVSVTDKCGTKYKVCLVDSNGDVYDWTYILLYGDVNCDGSVDGEDAVFVDMVHYGFLTIDDYYIREASDTNHDGIIDLFDSWMMEDAGIYNNYILQKAGS